MQIKILNTFKNKKVLITGHTGFKGSWLTMCLKLLGAKIVGVSKDYPTNPSHYKECNELTKVETRQIDICNFEKINNIIREFKPNFIFHLAAQPLVKKSVKNPIHTWKNNTIGTLNILEVLRQYKKKVNIVIITSDKVYFNFEKKSAYKENDYLGGKDPYSASKASAEIAVKSYYETYLKEKKNIRIAVARAGNVIGGGDWSADRLIPDCVKAWSRKKTVIIRNSNSTRPWQHVIEVVCGYMLLACLLNNKKKLNGEAFNFGPNTNKNYTVIDCLREIKKNWPNIKWKVLKKNKKFKEAGLLKLNSKKSYKQLKWKTVLNFKTTIKITSDWYKSFYNNKSILTIDQIKDYFKKTKVL